jgi:DNA-binding response OmpR family regulator
MDREVILTVDDSREIARFCSQVLLPELGYATQVAYTARQAYEIIRSTSISLMLLDLNLPDMTGFERCASSPTIA